jgi:EAL domain-containing protein (putative c-di-GMP-specific phosphodiesterase class I)
MVTDRATTVLNDLKTHGIRIALDDFGTGYASLSPLRRLPIDVVKIDQSFIADIGRTTTGSDMVSAVTNLPPWSGSPSSRRVWRPISSATPYGRLTSTS